MDGSRATYLFIIRAKLEFCDFVHKEQAVSPAISVTGKIQ